MTLSVRVVLPMVVKIVVGVTDRAWLEHRRAGPALAEVSFWSLRLRTVRARAPSEIFLLKLRVAIDRIAGMETQRTPREVMHAPLRF